MAQTSIFSGSLSGRSLSRQRAHRVTNSIGSFTLVVESFMAWRERARSRRDLMRLTEHQLKDIGLSRHDAEAEFQKPFWQA